MRAIVAREFGGPEVLEVRDVPEPEAGEGEVIIGVEVSPIDFVQTQLRSGYTPGPPLPEPPYLAGGGGAGRVVAVGQGVAADHVGRRVAARTSSGLGGHAERVVAKAEDVVPVPDELGFGEAAALLDDGGTAVGLTENAAIRDGETVLVLAASGGVGSLLLQLATVRGARVLGAARGERKLAAVAGLGAEPVDYSSADWPERVRELTGGAGPELVFDGVGGDLGAAAFATTRRGGRYSLHGAASGSFTDTSGATGRGVTVLPVSQLVDMHDGWRDRAARAMAEAAAGRLTPLIGTTLPFERAAEAHAAMEARAVAGKTLLLVGS